METIWKGCGKDVERMWKQYGNGIFFLLPLGFDNCKLVTYCLNIEDDKNCHWLDLILLIYMQITTAFKINKGLKSSKKLDSHQQKRKIV